MDKQHYIDNHIGIFKNFMPNELINDYLNYFNKVRATRCSVSKKRR